MQSLIVPERLGRERHNSEIEEQVAMVHDYAIMGHFNEELKKIDPNLSLVRAAENCTIEALKPGFWHVLRKEPGGIVTVIPVTHPNGEFMEPGSAMFDLIKASDLWDDRVLKDRRETQKKIKDAKENQKQRERDDKVQEFVERVQSRENGSVGWTASIA